MIATGDHCFRDDLLQLIDDKLSSDQEQEITRHLDHCAQCQQALQNLVGAPELWQEVSSILTTSPPSTQTNCRADNPTHPRLPNGDHVAWVSDLLQPSSQEDCLGLLDDRPVHGVIGHGGMGVVLRVWDAKLNRFLAAKMLSPMLASVGAARQRFFREAQSAAAVVHPNIVPIYDISTQSKLPYILMPVVDGGSLQQRIESHGPLPLVEVLAIGLQVAEALLAAHAQGLVHRDIKPANILLDSGGRRVLLSDFGLARTLDDASMTASGMISGTPHYMSPEQARGVALDGRSDLYGLGAVLFAMATGHPPVRGTSPLEVLRRVNEDPIPSACQSNETLPLWFDRLLLKFLDKARENRLADAQQGIDLLRGALAHLRSPVQTPLPDSLKEPSTASVPKAESDRSRRSSPFGLIAVATLLLSIVAGFTSGLLDDGRSKSTTDPDLNVAIARDDTTTDSFASGRPLDEPSRDVNDQRATGRPLRNKALAGSPVTPDATGLNSPAELPVPFTTFPSSLEDQLQQMGRELERLKQQLNEDLPGS